MGVLSNFSELFTSCKLEAEHLECSWRSGTLEVAISVFFFFFFFFLLFTKLISSISSLILSLIHLNPNFSRYLLQAKTERLKDIVERLANSIAKESKD